MFIRDGLVHWLATPKGTLHIWIIWIGSVKQGSAGMPLASAVHVRPITKEWAEKGDIPERALDRELEHTWYPEERLTVAPKTVQNVSQT